MGGKTTVDEKLRNLVVHWKAESKRIHGLAHKERSIKGHDSLMAQSVRYWNCASELDEILKDATLRGELRGERAS